MTDMPNLNTPLKEPADSTLDVREDDNADISSSKEKEEEDRHLLLTSNDIDDLLHSKAEKSKLSVTNVKNILKNVILNENVIEMVCSSLQGKQINLPYEPKLTRSKTRELRNKNQPLSSVCTLPLTDLVPKAKTSECHVLIDKELSDETSDEEYVPSEEIQSEDDIDIFRNRSACSTPFPSSTLKGVKRQKLIKRKKRRHHVLKRKRGDDFENSYDKLSDKLNETVDNNSTSCSGTLSSEQEINNTERDCISNISSEIKETIGHRTRSKLSLSQTPLETIEQQFIPPDITCDMYDWNCDNEDWKNFLKEFTQPLDALPDLNETADDVEADPEYNVLADEDAADEDNEELRMDRAVKVSRKELNDLMKELFEYSEMMSNIEQEKKDKEKAKKKIRRQNLKHEEKLRKENEKKNKDKKVSVNLDSNQKLLLDQQLRQHVQLTTQHYLQTYCHPVLHYLSLPLKSYLYELHELRLKESKLSFDVPNLISAINLIEKWEKILNSDNGHNIIKFMEKEVEKSDKCLERQVLRVCDFPPSLMRLICESNAFPYPLLLPPLPFYSYNLPEEFVPSEEKLLILGYSQFLPYVKENKKVFKISPSVRYAAEFISKYMMPIHSDAKILRFTKTQRTRKGMNMLKEYFLTHKLPSLIHYIIPIYENTRVKDHPRQLLPCIWNDYLNQRNT